MSGGTNYQNTQATPTSGNSIFPAVIPSVTGLPQTQEPSTWDKVKQVAFGWFNRPPKTEYDINLDRPLSTAEQQILKVAYTYGLDIDMIQRGTPWRRMAWYDNPDINIRKNAFITYDTMMLDSQVRTAVNGKRFSVISSDWEVVPVSDSEQDKEIADFVTWCLYRCRGTVSGIVFELLNAIVHGYAIAEMNFKVVESGRWKGKWMLDAVPAKNPLDYEFQLDPCGKIESIFLGYRTPIPNFHLPREKFLVYTYQPQYDRVYGRSDLQGCYWDWWFKQRIEKIRGIYLERYAIPLMHGKIPAGQKSLLRDLKAALKNLGGQDNLVITPTDVEIALLSDGKQATDAYDGAIQYYNGQIVKCILGQTLTSGEGDRSGSMALGKVHESQQEDWVTFLRNDIAEFLTENLVRVLVSLNYNTTEFPRFVWVPRKEKLIIEKPSELKALIETGILVESDANIFRIRLDLPKVSKYEGSDKQLKVTLPVGAGGGGIVEQPEETPEEKPEEKNKFSACGCGKGKETFKKVRDMYACEERLGGVEYYAKIVKRVDRYNEDFINALTPLIKDAQLAILNYYQQKVANPAQASATELSIRQMSFPATIKKRMTETSKRIIAQVCYDEYDEMLREQNVKKGIPELPKEKYAKRTDVTLQTAPDAMAIKKMMSWVENGDWEAAKAWRAKQIASVAGTNETKVDFYITDVIEQDCLKEVKTAIFNGMHSGRSIDEISKSIGDVFKKFGSDPKLTDPVRLEMITRTNINNAIADARLEAARDPETMDAFPALMFSALMEEGTCQECADLDGNVYAADDPIWNTITPTLHPNCNCWVIGVDAETYKNEGDSDRPDVEAIAARKGL